SGEMSRSAATLRTAFKVVSPAAMPDVLMPRLSDSMEAGTILQWLVAPGGAVRSGQRLVEIETDKATETCDAEADGVLEIVAAVGDTVPVGAVIARIGDGQTTDVP